MEEASEISPVAIITSNLVKTGGTQNVFVIINATRTINLTELRSKFVIACIYFIGEIRFTVVDSCWIPFCCTAH